MRVHFVGRSLIAFAVSWASITMAGPIWMEPGDAGHTPGTAQSIDGDPAAFLQQIQGSLSTSTRAAPNGFGDFEDVYLIRIVSLDVFGQPCTFSASTSWMVEPGGVNDFDTQIWLFSPIGTGLLGNDDASPGVLQSVITFPSTDGTNVNFPGTGLYLLGISGWDNDPVSAGGPIFSQDMTTEISGPDGAGGGLPLTGWTSPGDSDTGMYDIRLTCTTFVPEPACAASLLLGGWLLRRKRPLRR